jgi:glycosyltransferase involved in cell wall biosynthesis
MQADRRHPGPARGLAVALLTPSFWPEVRRGTERIVAELARGLAARGHLPRVITSHPRGSQRTAENGVEIVRNRRPPDRWLNRYGLEPHLTHVPLSYGNLSRMQPDVAHAFYVTDALAAIRWSRRTGRPSVLTYTGIPDRRGLLERRWRLAITQRAVVGCDSIVAVSKAGAEAFHRWLGIEAELVYPGIDLATFTPCGDRAPDPTIFCAGAIEEPRKRVGMLVGALRIVRRSRPKARLTVFKPSPSLAGQLRREPGVDLIEPVRSDELAPLYSSAWVSALPAVGEAFGLVLAEALACGTPVVGSSHGGIPEVIDRPEVGRTFRDEDGEEGLARALLEVIELAEDPVTRGACVTRAQDFSTDRATEAYEGLYARL